MDGRLCHEVSPLYGISQLISKKKPMLVGSRMAYNFSHQIWTPMLKVIRYRVDLIKNCEIQIHFVPLTVVL